MVEPEDSLTLRTKADKWLRVKKVSLWLFLLCMVAVSTVFALSVLQHVPNIAVFVTAGIWVLVTLVWVYATLKSDKLDEAAHRAATLEKFEAISRKYQERLKHVGRRTP